MTAPRPDGLVFDLDGTLWDAAAASVEGWNLALAEMAAPYRVTADGIRSVSGTPFARCVEALLPALWPPAEGVLRSLEERERRVIEHSGGTLYEGVLEGVRALAAVYPLYLVSNCLDWYLEAFLRSSGLRDYFRGWDCHGASGAPKAEMLLRLVARDGLERAVYVGDTLGDQEAAHAAGLDFAFVRYGFGHVENASRSFRSFDQLAEYFLLQTV